MLLRLNIKRLTSSMEMQEIRHSLKTPCAYSDRSARSNCEICIFGQLTNPATIENDIAKTMHVVS